MDQETIRLLVQVLKGKAENIQASEANRLAMEHNRQLNLALTQKELLDDTSSDSESSGDTNGVEEPTRFGIQLSPEILSEIDELRRLEKEAPRQSN
jgi:hypothetical protein